MAERMYTADEVAAATMEFHKVAVGQIKELCDRVALAEHQRDQALELLKRIGKDLPQC